jgi:hypothetical protein
MAVLNKFANALVAAGKKGPPIATGGAQILAFAGTYELAAADDDASVLRIARLPANAIPMWGTIYCDAITGMTSLDLGLYKPGVDGAVVDADLFAAALDLNAGVTVVTDANNAFTTQPVIDNVGETLWQLLGLTKPNRQDYDLAFTFNTIGSAAGTISWKLLFAIG